MSELLPGLSDEAGPSADVVVPPAESFPSGGLIGGAIVDGCHIPEDWQTRFGGRVWVDPESAEFCFLYVLSCPDLRRFPMPIEPESSHVAVDLSQLSEKTSASDVRKMVTDTLPMQQLQALYEFEWNLARSQNKKKPRRVAIEAIDAELNRRTVGFAGWLRETMSDPLRCEIAAAAVAVGSADPQVFVVGRDGSECDLLSLIWQETNGRTVAGAGVYDGWQVVRVRSRFFDFENRRAANQLFCRQQYAGDSMAVAAAAYGLPFDALLSDAEVFEAFTSRNVPRLGAETRNRFEMSRAVILSERTC